MKFRNGFVTNSSSSSFICQICGDVQSGWDMSFDEAGFVECENGHEFCVSHLINLPDGMEEYESFLHPANYLQTVQYPIILFQYH